MSEHKLVHLLTWYQVTFDQKTIIVSVIVSLDLQRYVSVIWVKTVAEQSTDHHLVVSWIPAGCSKANVPPTPQKKTVRKLNIL